MDDYKEFLENKIVIAEETGFNIKKTIGDILPHAEAITKWCLKGGRRAIFASFGLTKTAMQLELAYQVIKKTKKPFLIVMPLGVVGEFKRDNELYFGNKTATEYITDSESIENYEPKIYLTNYERIRKGDIDASKFGGVSFDEASILRNLKTETTNYVLEHFRKVHYRFVATATPTPNDFIEILNYADYLGVIDRGHALTRFFQRDSTKAGHLTLYPNKKEEFWKWVSTWAVFINKPSDLGFDDTGYNLPKMHIHEIEVKNYTDDVIQNKQGDIVLFKDVTKSLVDVSREKSDSVDKRVLEVKRIISIFNKSLNTENDRGKEEVPKGILPEKQRSSFNKAEVIKQKELSREQAETSFEKSTLGKEQFRENERIATEASTETRVERLQEKTLSGKYGVKQNTNKEQQTEKILRDNSGAIFINASVTTGEVYDLQENEQRNCTKQEGKSGCRPLPQNNESERSALPPLQCSSRSISRRSRDIKDCNRLSEQIIIWCDLNKEQIALERMLRANNLSYVSLYGGESIEVREKKVLSWKNKEVDIFLSKSSMYGCGINMQQASKMIFAGINYKFHLFIQSIHRIFRFQQKSECHIWLILTNNENEVLKALKNKWANHIELQTEMINIVREYGLNSDKIKADMKRQIFTNGRSATIGTAKVFNNDTVVTHNEMADNSTDMILTSIPFGDHYEYSDNYNDMGHNNGNVEFFKQMDFLTPNLLRTLKPGRIAAIHVKDRIRYSYQNGTSFTSIADFSGQTVAHFEKHGFYLIGKITVTTDVVRENNQTYRLGWTEQCKDASKMGVGLPEYILLFRKAPTSSDNAYADKPVFKDKVEYNIATWQLDAHAYWKSSGNRFLSLEEMKGFDFKHIVNKWKQFNTANIYDFREHLEACENLEEAGKLSRLFMTLPTHSNNDMVWTDINRMKTLNANQANRKKEKHICPLQLDIIERLINRFTMKGEIVDDPFGGLFSTAYKALEMGRGAISTELNPEYYDDGLFYLKSIEYKLSVPTLFDLENIPESNIENNIEEVING